MLSVSAEQMYNMEQNNIIVETHDTINEDQNEIEFLNFPNVSVDVDVDVDNILEYHTDAATEALNLLLPELQQQDGGEGGESECNMLECDNFDMDVDDFNNCLNNLFCLDGDGDGDLDGIDINVGAHLIDVPKLKNNNNSDNVTTTTRTTTETTTIPDINNVAKNVKTDEGFVVNIAEIDVCSDSSNSNNSATTTTNHIIYHNNSSNKNNTIINHNVVVDSSNSSSNSNKDMLSCRSHNDVFA